MIKNNINGRSMIEMIGVLAIIGILSIGGIAGYSRAMTRYRVNRTIDETSRLVNTIRTMYMTQRNFKGIEQNNGQMNATIAKSIKNYTGFDPLSSNVFGGRWFVQSHHPNCNSNSQYCNPQSEISTAFVVAFEKVPEDACMELATINWANAGDGLIGFGIGKGDTRTVYSATKKDCPKGSMQKNGSNGYWICAQDLPLSPADAVTACSFAGNNTYNFSFKYK